jgi:hypothetical protein
MNKFIHIIKENNFVFHNSRLHMIYLYVPSYNLCVNYNDKVIHVQCVYINYIMQIRKKLSDPINKKCTICDIVLISDYDRSTN